MSDFYRKKAKEDQRKKQAQAYEDQLNKQGDEIYSMLESSPAFTPKFLQNLEKKDIKKEIQNTSYEEVLASKLELIQKANKWESTPFLILRIIVAVIAISFLIFLFNLDEATLKDLFG